MAVEAKQWTDHKRRVLDKAITLITQVSLWIGIAALAAIVLIVFVDVCGRYLLNMPTPVAYDLVEQSLVVMAGFSITLASLKGIHPSIDLVTIRFPRVVRTLMNKAYSLLGFVVAMAMTYSLWFIALNFLKKKTTLMILQVNPAPFVFLLAIGLFLCGLTCLIQMFLPTEEDAGQKERYDE
jgi:TRAP-type C4-dicarboxylate transport system permease small subunit